MNDEANIEDVEQSETNEVRSLTEEPPESLEEAGFDEEKWGISDADTDKGVEEDPIETLEEGIRKLEETVEELPPLPTVEEAELGELARKVPKTQFGSCELVDNDTPDLIGVLEEEEPKGATDEEVRQAVLEIEGGEN